MQSIFLLTTVIFVLSVHVSTCCIRSICHARCYLKHNGFDYGYCHDDDGCVCAPPDVYVFDGKGRGYDENAIEELWTDTDSDEDVTNESEVSTSGTNQNLETWNNIVKTITEKYPIIEKENLENLKTQIINDGEALNSFYMNLKQPLEYALNTLKKDKPYTSEQCDELLKHFQQNETESFEDVSEIEVFESNHKSQDTSPVKQSTAPKTKLTSSNTRNLMPITNSKPELESNSNVKTKNEDKNYTSKLKDSQNLVEKPKTKSSNKTITEDEEVTRNVFVEESEEYIDDDSASDEYYDDEETELPTIQKNKATNNIQSVKIEDGKSNLQTAKKEDGKNSIQSVKKEVGKNSIQSVKKEDGKINSQIGKKENEKTNSQTIKKKDGKNLSQVVKKEDGKNTNQIAKKEDEKNKSQKVKEEETGKSEYESGSGSFYSEEEEI